MDNTKVENEIVKNMWCLNCKIETHEKVCPICGEKTVEDIPIEVYWCKNCKVPIIQKLNQPDKGSCPCCGKKTRYLSTDLRPVFPEERLLLELLLEKEPNEYMDKSVWAINSRYYIDGKSVSLPSGLFKDADAEKLREQLILNQEANSYKYFDEFISRFISINRDRLNEMKEEAFDFVRKTAEIFDEERIVLSFSGGKDSTVTADVVIKALSNPYLVHIFGNTTLEFPYTIEYAERYREDHPDAIFKIAKNNEQIFYDVCEDIGPPARMMRWCCSMFKTGPITRVINSLYRNQQILTFYGIRKAESVSRSKYNRVEDDSESVKIQQQTVASPIFFWRDIDIWLYMLGEKVDFNYAYRLGYDRVGCWCCPNNNLRAQFLSRIYMPEQSKKWRDFLIDFAIKVGKPDPEEYVDAGWWKARQGGNGLVASGDVKIRFTNCTSEEHAKIYRLASILKDWCDSLEESVFEQLFTDGTDKCLGLLRSVSNDDGMTVSRLAKLATDLRIEDWDEKTRERFIEKMKMYKETAENHKGGTADTEDTTETNTYQVSFTDESGDTVTKRFERVESSKRGKLLFNSITAEIESMGRSISDQEKRQILMDILKTLC